MEIFSKDTFELGRPGYYMVIWELGWVDLEWQLEKWRNCYAVGRFDVGRGVRTMI